MTEALYISAGYEKKQNIRKETRKDFFYMLICGGYWSAYSCWYNYCEKAADCAPHHSRLSWSQ